MDYCKQIPQPAPCRPWKPSPDATLSRRSDITRRGRRRRVGYLCLHHPAAEASHLVHQAVDVEHVAAGVVDVLQEAVNHYKRPWPSHTSAAGRAT